MVLDHIANRADLIVEGAAPLHAEVLGHRDLHAADELASPERLEERIGEPEKDHILDGTLAEIMIDAKDMLFIEDAEQDLIELARGCKVPAKRFFEDDASIFVAA